MKIPEILKELSGRDMGIRLEGNSISLYKYKKPMNELIIYIDGEKIDNMEMVLNGRFKIHELQWMLNLINEVESIFEPPIERMSSDHHAITLMDNGENSNREINQQEEVSVTSKEVKSETGDDLKDFDPDIKRINDYKEWTKEEEQFLKDNYKIKSTDEMARYLGRTRASVNSRLALLNIKPDKRRVWTKEEIDFLRENYQTMSAREISKKLGRSLDAVTQKANRERITKDDRKEWRFWTEDEDKFLVDAVNEDINLDEVSKLLDRTIDAIENRINTFRNEGILDKIKKNWTEKENDFLRENHEKMIIPEMAVKLGRTESALTSQMAKLGLAGRTTRGSNSKWTKKDETFLINNYQTMSNDELSKILGRSKRSITGKAGRLKLRKYK